MSRVRSNFFLAHHDGFCPRCTGRGGASKRRRLILLLFVCDLSDNNRCSWPEFVKRGSLYNCGGWPVSQPRLVSITHDRRTLVLCTDLSARLLPPPLQVQPLTLEAHRLTLPVQVT